MMKQNGWFGAAVYNIKVGGTLNNESLNWFEGLTVQTDGAMTIIGGEIPDQSALQGLLTRILDLGLPLISIERVTPDPGSQQK